MDRKLPIFSFNGIFGMLILILLCVGCAPTLAGIYYPKADDGEVIYADFPLSAHMPTEICFSQNDVKIHVEFKKYKKRKYVKIRFKIPEGYTVQLLGNRIYARCRKCSNQIEGEFKNIFLSDYSISILDKPYHWGMDINAPMKGGKIRDTTIDKNFWLMTYLDVPSVKDIHISLPQFTVNGELVILPEIRWRKRIVPAIWMFNS